MLKSLQKHNFKQLDLIFSILVFILAYSTFYCIYNFVVSDIPAHIGFARSITVEGQPYPGNFLLYLAVQSIAFFNPKYFGYSMIMILAASVLFKFMLSTRVLRECNELNKDLAKNRFFTNILSCFLIVAFSLPIPALWFGMYYLGQFTPNVWHNSTTIALMPFAILLFYQAYKYLGNPNKKVLIRIIILILINAAIKPSFLFAFVVSYPVFAWISEKKLIYKTISPVVIALAIIAAQYYLIYHTKNIYNESGIELGLFKVYKIWLVESPNLLISFVLALMGSFAFPVLTYLKLPKDKMDIQTFAFINTIAALLIFILISESGLRASDGNFIWQVHIASFIWFLASASALLKKINIDGLLKYRFQVAAFFLHVVSGLVYLLGHLLVKETFI